MSVLQYSKCRILFTPTDSRYPQRDYSDRSLIELHLGRDGQYSLRGVDVANNKSKIFEFPLTEGLYKFGSSHNNWDEIRDQNGKYRLWLEIQTGENFRKELRQSLDELKILKKNSPDINSEISHQNKSPKLPTNSNDRENILIDIHKLGKYITTGDADSAARKASKLALQPIKLTSKTLDGQINHDTFKIRVKLDGINVANVNINEPCLLNVHRLTTVHELRMFFEYKEGFPSANQYFFVNGHLAFEESTMEDLKVGKNSLFVLFLTE